MFIGKRIFFLVFLCVLSFAARGDSTKLINIEFVFPHDGKGYWEDMKELYLRVPGKPADTVSSEGMTETEIRSYLKRGYCRWLRYAGAIAILYRRDDVLSWPGVYCCSFSWLPFPQKREKFLERQAVEMISTQIRPRDDEQMIMVWISHDLSTMKMFIPAPNKVRIFPSQKEAKKGLGIATDAMVHDYPLWLITWPAFDALLPVPKEIADFVKRELEIKQKEEESIQIIKIK